MNLSIPISIPTTISTTVLLFTIHYQTTLTNPSLGSAKLVIMGGLAELFSGAISMGLGAYLAAITERDHYIAEEAREREEIRTRPEEEKEGVYEIMEGFGLDRVVATPLVEVLVGDVEVWVKVR